jgi:hypothetical protein
MMTQEWQKEELCPIPPVCQEDDLLEPVYSNMVGSSNLNKDEWVECHENYIRTKPTSG